MQTYQIYVDIADIKRGKKQKVVAACCEVLGFSQESFQEAPCHANRMTALAGLGLDDVTDQQNRLTASGQVQLEDADDAFIDRLAQAVWEAGKGYAIVAVFAIQLRNVPILIRDRVDFLAWKKAKRQAASDATASV